MTLQNATREAQIQADKCGYQIIVVDDPSKFTTDDPLAIRAIRLLLEEIGNDGHTIWRPTILGRFPDELQARFIKNHLSDTDDPKGMIFNKAEQVVDQVNGVYGLTVLRAIASDLGVEYEWKMGRGSSAAAITKALNEHLAKL